MDDRILVDQEQYILENVKSVFLEKGRRADHKSRATGVERRSSTTLVYQLNGVGKETRPEVAGTASMLAARVKAPAIGDVLEANAAAQLLRYPASPIVPALAPLVTAQCAWRILAAAERGMQTGVSAEVTPLV